jgi:hypothetical protein
MSIVNHEFKHVFIHVPKTAGSSMEELSYVGGNGHKTARQLLRYNPDDYFSWGFVRNPLDRIVSAYHSLKENPSHHTPDIDEMNFDEWIASGAEDKSSKFWSYAHALPMTHYLCDEHNNILVDFIGKYERLTEDWHSLSEKLNFKAQLLPKINVARPRAHWSQFYKNRQTLTFARELYDSDFMIFEYDDLV